MALDNIAAAARQVLDSTGRTPAVELAVADVIAACEQVELDPAAEDLQDDHHTPEVDQAEAALQRLRAVALVKDR